MKDSPGVSTCRSVEQKRPMGLTKKRVVESKICVLVVKNVSKKAGWQLCQSIKSVSKYWSKFLELFKILAWHCKEFDRLHNKASLFQRNCTEYNSKTEKTLLKHVSNHVNMHHTVLQAFKMQDTHRGGGTQLFSGRGVRTGFLKWGVAN